MSSCWRGIAFAIAAVAMFVLTAGNAYALPSFARQTGLECTNCHLSWLELTTVGRQFKLGGYTLIKPSTDRPMVSFAQDTAPPVLPLAAFVQASLSRTANTTSNGSDPSQFPKNNDVVVQQASVFLAGRLADHVGTFAQWTYDGVEHHSTIDNAELRFADVHRGDGFDVVYGMALNNNPGMSDIYNTTPVWGFPFASSGVAPTPAASTLMQEALGQQVAGLTAYAMWNRTLYTEVGAYRTADGAFSLFRAGVDRDEAAVLDGLAPYWRLALQHEWDEGTQSMMVGAFGLTAKVYPDPTAAVGPTNRFRDVGLDAQYQFITDAHRIGAQIARIQETQTLDATFAAGGSSNASNHLNALTAKLSYYYQLKYGVTLGYQSIDGDTDAGLYSNGDAVDGSINGSPNSAAWILELNWLPWRDRRFTLQYTAYQKFNGARDNYDGFGRNARDNNTLYLLAWFPF